MATLACITTLLVFRDIELRTNLEKHSAGVDVTDQNPISWSEFLQEWMGLVTGTSGAAGIR